VSSTAPWINEALAHNRKKAADGGAALRDFAEQTGAQNNVVRRPLPMNPSL
jgi:hypothetical protein